MWAGSGARRLSGRCRLARGDRSVALAAFATLPLSARARRKPVLAAGKELVGDNACLSTEDGELILELVFRANPELDVQGRCQVAVSILVERTEGALLEVLQNRLWKRMS